MVFKSLRLRIGSRFPVVSAGLVLSCLITTLPQLALGDSYSRIAGAPGAAGHWWCFSLSAFSHSPDLLIPHLVGNLAVIILLGSAAELIVGSNCYALVSLVSFGLSSALSWLRGVGAGHGASGIVWGFHLFALFFLIVSIERFGARRALRDRYFLAAAILSVFDFFGIPLVETLVQGRRFFENFGQVIHLAVALFAAAYILARRRGIEADFLGFLRGEPAGKERRSPWIYSIFALFALNAAATIFIASKVAAFEPIAYSISAAESAGASSCSAEFRVSFSAPMRRGSERIVRSSIAGRSGDIELSTRWIGDSVLLLRLSCPLEEIESARFAGIAASGQGQVQGFELNYP